MNVINNALKFFKGYLPVVAGVVAAVLTAPATVQAMPGMTGASTTQPTALPVAVSPFAEFEPLYRQHCSACHGDKGDGKSRAQHGLRPPPRNFTTAEAWQELDRDRMINSVTLGRPNTAMVGWEGRLTAAQIAGVVDYVRSSFMRESNQHAVSAVPVAVTPVLNTSKQAGSRGRDIYKRNCSACHGDQGSGATWTQNGLNPPPRDFTSTEARQLLTRERMISSVTHGRPGTAMMPFSSRLSPQEIASVVDYIRGDFMRVGGAAAKRSTASAADVSVNPHAGGHTGQGAVPLEAGQHQRAPVSHAPPPPPPSMVESDMSLQLPHGLVGDVVAGREFYMANCFTCHGVRGDGHGPRSSFITPRPRNFLGQRARKTLNRPALFRAIAAGLPGTVMPSWSKVLNNQQIADVTEFVFQTFIQQKKKAEPTAAVTHEPVPAVEKAGKSAAISTTQATESPSTAE